MSVPRFVGLHMLSAFCAVGWLTAPASADEGEVPEPAAPIPYTVDEHGRPPLLAAALAGDGEKVKQLLAAGSDPKFGDANGLTPLMAAAINDHAPMVEALIAAGAPVETVDARIRTALGYAVAMRNSAAIGALLAHHVELPQAAQGGADLAAAALDSGEPKLLDTILRRLPGGLAWTPAARHAFAWALAARDAALGSLLLAKYTGPPAPGEHAQPLLAYAVASGDLERVRTLLDFGADPNTTLDQPGDAAFREWISSNYVKYYLDSTQGISVLMLAAGLKQTDCVKLLLERGANRLGVTSGKARLIALYFACWSDSPETIQALITGSPSKQEMWIDVSIDEQRARFYRGGLLVLSCSVSTGRSGFPTRPGEYVVTDKNRHHRSSIYREASMPFFMRLSCRDFGLHQGVVSRSFASHGCIRLPGHIAQQLFKEVPIGTWVTIRRSSGETAAAKPVPRKP